MASMTRECLYHTRSIKREMLACAAHCPHVQIPHLPRLASIPLRPTSHLTRSIHGLGLGFVKLVQWYT